MNVYSGSQRHVGGYERKCAVCHCTSYHVEFEEKPERSMQLPFRNGAQRVLQWNADTINFDIAQCLSDEVSANCIPVDQAPNRAAFLLQLIQRQHALAVVVASHPFGEDLNLLRQFMQQLTNGPPIVLVLIDCPFSILGLEKDFFAVVQVRESHGELTRVLDLALEQSMAWQLGAHAENIVGETGGEHQPAADSVYQELTRAKQMPIVSIIGEVGTGKMLLAKLLHQLRGGVARDCFTFYCGQPENSVVASIEHLLQFSPAAHTFMLRDPSKAELNRIAGMFAATKERGEESASQLIVLSEVVHQIDSVYAVRLMALRDRAEFIPELAAGILTGLAKSFPDSPIEIEPAGISFLQNYNWPGNICEFNLALADSLLAQAVNAGSVIRLTPKVLRAALPFDRKIGGLTRKQLRHRLSETCEIHEKSGWGARQEFRELLNQGLLHNARLAWQMQPHEQVQVNQKKTAA